MTTPKDEQRTLMAGYNIVLDDLSNWAKVKYVATGDEAWLNLAVEFFQDVGTAKMQEARLDRVAPGERWSDEDGPDGGDIAAIIAYQFVETTNPWLLEPGYPRLAALAERGMEVGAIAATKPEA